MLNTFKGKLVLKQENNLFLENLNEFKKIYVCNPNDFHIENEYKFYTYTYKTQLNKGLEVKINFGFLNIYDAIHFEELISIDGIGIKTSLKIITYGYKEFLELIRINDIKEMAQKYNISTNVINIFMQYFKRKELNSYSNEQIKKINSAIINLEQLGYDKQLSTKIVWNRKEEILNNNFSLIFYLLLEDIKNERNRIEA